MIKHDELSNIISWYQLSLYNTTYNYVYWSPWPWNWPKILRGLHSLGSGTQFNGSITSNKSTAALLAGCPSTRICPSPWGVPELAPQTGSVASRGESGGFKAATCIAPRPHFGCKGQAFRWNTSRGNWLELVEVGWYLICSAYSACPPLDHANLERQTKLAPGTQNSKAIYLQQTAAGWHTVGKLQTPTLWVSVAKIHGITAPSLAAHSPKPLIRRHCLRH